MRITRQFTFAIVTGFGLVAVAAAGSFLGNVDYSALPPSAAEVHKQIGEHNIKLTQAIDIAQREVNGIAKAAALRLDQTPATVEVEVYSEDKAHRVVVNADNGDIISNDVTDGPWTTTDSGVKYYDIKVGEGVQPEMTSVVTVHYTGWLVNGREFDSSHNRGRPYTLPLNQFVPGWAEGVSTMKVGGKRKLIIPHSLAYGEMGRPPVIPAKATLVFEVELLNVASAPGQTDHDHSGHDHKH